MRDRRAGKPARRDCQPNLKKLINYDRRGGTNPGLRGFAPTYAAIRDTVRSTSRNEEELERQERARGTEESGTLKVKGVYIILILTFSYKRKYNSTCLLLESLTELIKMDYLIVFFYLSYYVSGLLLP